MFGGPVTIDHAVVVAAANRGGKLSMVICDSLASNAKSEKLIAATQHVRAGISFVLTEAQRTFSGCKMPSRCTRAAN